jgi:HEPN domain-containing protein
MDLLTLLHQAGVDIPEGIRRAGLLTGYAVESRYPGPAEEVSREEYVEAVEIAERVVAWAESLASVWPKETKA